MKKNVYPLLLTLSAVISLYSCRKENTSFSNIHQQIDVVIDTPVVHERYEILSAVYDFKDWYRPGRLQVFDIEGNLLKEKIIETALLDFARWKVNGQYRYSYIALDPTIQTMKGVGYMPGHVTILNENLDEINQLLLLPYNGRTMALPVDAHDFIYLDDDHYITMSYVETAVDNIPASLNPAQDIKVVACIIQEVKNGQVVFEWNATDYPEFYTTSVEGNDFTNSSAVRDYAHLNSIFIDPNDNNIVASFRNLDQVVKIHRQTGKILWRLGGTNSDFVLNTQQKFLRQHHATITKGDNTLLMFDNGDQTLRPYSRVVEFKLNEVTRVVTGFKAIDVPENAFGQYMGSVQKTGNSYFIGCGSASKIYEVDNKTLQVIFQKKLDGPSYRSYKY
ncbi:MAG: aryl-sulfate sulfotransferase [Chitinophagales bacterium]|nr:aryl-sulfate sulfotransferase [Chitinophagales bacterium]